MLLISWFTGPWFNSSILSLGFTIARAFPAPRPPGYPCVRELLEPKTEFLTNTYIRPKDEPATWFCTLCEIPSQSCDDFVNHLKSTFHSQQLVYSNLVFVDENNRCFHFSRFSPPHPVLWDNSMTIPWIKGDLMYCLSDPAFNRILYMGSNAPRRR
ncbi:unnamed protein product [Arabis nemorensis]|uniref:C2H2-type domain-containing protein n=1 Tax=Arabis nemorensis TaxID=586526 RepID=A0A565CI46_9BRAS|nr:unnamed protein product [Arabis nemorensis]